MAKRIRGATGYIDALDRVLDKGIVFDAWIRMSLGGIDLITVETHVIVVSIDTYLKGGPAFDPAVPPSSNLSPSTRTPAVSQEVSFPMSPLLFIIAADRPNLFEKWTAEFPELARQVVVLDRRRHDRRQEIHSVHKDHRQAARRIHNIDRELELVGLAVVTLAEDV